MSEQRINEFGQPIGPDVSVDLPVPTITNDPLDGRYCRLAALDVAAHAGPLFEAYAEAVDARGWTYLPGGPFDDVDGLARWLGTLTRMANTAFFAICDADGPGGVAAYLRIDPRAPSVEVGGIHFAPRLQQTAAATESMYLMMRRAFDLGYRRYEWKCDSLNAPSRSAAERLGFTHEGEFRNALVYKKRSRDTSWFSITDAEWPARRAEFERWLDPSNFDADGNQRTRLSQVG